MVKAVLFDWGRVLRSKTSGRRAKVVFELAEDLRSHGIKTGIISNIYSVLAKAVRVLGDYKQFDPVILSCDVGINKPEAGIYREAVKKLRLKPEEVIFVDNREENVKAAEKLGMKTVLAKNSEQIVAEVRALILRENGLKL